VKWLWRCLLLFAPACVSPLAALKQQRPVTASAGTFVIQYAPIDDGEQPRVVAAIEQAMPTISQWGPLKAPITIYLLPSHDDLESAVGRHGYDWLKAWARYDEIYLQSPRTWGARGAADNEIIELLKHELTHCAMYQRIGTPESWAQKSVPLWFREGMATWTAGQAHRWPTLEELSHFLNTQLADPISSPEDLYQLESDVVYAAAHYAFTFLVIRYGTPKIHALLNLMQLGSSFEGAFQQSMGVSAHDFTSEFARFVRWRAYRGSGKSIKTPTPQ
jgi:hypothetical protein